MWITRRPLTGVILMLVTALLVGLGMPDASAEQFTSEEKTSGEPKILGVLDTGPLARAGSLAAVGDPRSGRRDSRPDDERSRSGGTHGGMPQAIGDLKPAPGCYVQCIKSGVAWAVGVGAYLEIETDTPAAISLYIEEEQAGQGQGHQADTDGIFTTEWGKTFPHLKPNTTYGATVMATDEYGFVSWAFGKFTTLRRFVTVDFGGFEITKHPGLEDHFNFFFYVHGERYDELKETYPEPYLPATLPGHRAVTLEDAPKYTSAKVVVAQLDPGSLDSKAYGHGYTNANILLDNYPEDATSWTQSPLFTEHAVSVDNDIEFAAPVNFTVWYE